MSARAGFGLRALLPTLAAIFAIDAMTALVIIGYGNTYLINSLSAPASYPAYALAIYGLVKLVSAPVGGWVLDRFPARTIAAAACGLELAGFGVILATHTARGYLGGVALLASGIALAWLVVFHAVGKASDAQGRGSATAYMGLTSVSATAVGFGIAALIGESRHWQAAFALGIAFAVVSSLSLLRLRRRDPRVTEVESPVELSPVAEPRALRRFAFVVVLVHFAVITATLGAFGPFALRTLDLSLLQAGLLIAPAMLAGAGAMYLAGHRSKHGRRLTELGVLYLVGAAALVWISTIHHPVFLLLAAVPFAISLAGVHPLMNASLLDAAHAGDRAGTALGWLFFAEGLGSVFGPLAIGTVIELAGVRVGLLGLSGTVFALGAGAVAANRLVRL